MEYTQVCKVCINDCVDKKLHDELLGATCYTYEIKLNRSSKNFNKAAEHILYILTKAIVR